MADDPHRYHPAAFDVTLALVRRATSADTARRRGADPGEDRVARMLRATHLERPHQALPPMRRRQVSAVSGPRLGSRTMFREIREKTSVWAGHAGALVPTIVAAGIVSCASIGSSGRGSVSVQTEGVP